MIRGVSHGSLAVRLLAIFALGGLLAAGYFFAIRPPLLRWGATAEEVARPMPGDDLVPSPSFCATRAITLPGKPGDAWPWLAQMGYRRAGFYGYDLIENLGSGTGIRSAEGIVPSLQHPKTGDELPISAVASMVFGSVEPGSYLVWRGTVTPSDGSLTWALYPVDDSHTRLISRVRLHYHWSNPGLLALDLFTEFGDHVAVPKILQGIKGRMEGRPAQSLAEEGAEIAVWLLAMAELAAGVVFVLCWRRWDRAWLLALAAGILVLFDLYAHAPMWIGAVLDCALLGGMITSWRASAGDPVRA